MCVMETRLSGALSMLFSSIGNHITFTSFHLLVSLPSVWFTLLLNLLTDHPIALPQLKSLLCLPHSNAVQPLSGRLLQLACKVSGSLSARELPRAKLWTSSCYHSPLGPQKNMPHISRNGMTVALNGTLIHIAPV